MKKIIISILVLILCLNFVSAAPQKEIKVTIDGKEVVFPDQKPIIESQRTLVPVRFVTEALGAKVDWVQQEQKVKIEKSGELIELILGKEKVKAGNKSIELDVPAKAINQRTMVPLRFISETLGCTVDWVQESYTVVISTRKSLTDMSFDERVAVLQKVPMREKTRHGQTYYKDISETIYEKYKNLGNKIVLTGKSNGIYYDANGVPEGYKWNTPLMLQYGTDGSSYGVAMMRNADEQAFEILLDIIKIFLPEKQGYEKAYALYKEYFNMKPSNDDDCKWFVSADGRTEFQMHNSETGVVCDFFYKGVGK